MRSLAATLLILFLATARGGAEQTAVYAMRGVLRSFDPATGQATVSHDAVPGYMPAMTMDFAADPAGVGTLHPGDPFTCRLCVTGDRAWIEDIHTVNAPAAFGLPSAAPSTERKPGDELPDLALVDESGATVRLSDFRGRTLALTFIYLRCPLPTYCPLMNRNFQAAQGLLDRLGLKERTHFLSVSMDAVHDTPTQLAAFAEAVEADRQVWTFAAAPAPALRPLTDAVGLEFKILGDGVSHNLRAVVIDPQGKLRRVFRGNTWTPQELVAEMRAADAAR